MIYVGKAVNLRSRVGSYFNSAAAVEIRTANLIPEIRDIDFIAAESEVDALLMEARLIKDVQPQFNKELKDDKTFPYLEIPSARNFRASSSPASRGREATKLYGPFTSAKQAARGDAGAAEDLPLPHVLARHRRKTTNAGAGSGRACWPASTSARPRAICGSAKRSTASDIRRLRLFLEGKKDRLLARNEGRDGAGRQGAEVRKGGPHPRRDSRLSRTSICAASWTSTSSRKCSTSTRKRGWPA